MPEQRDKKWTPKVGLRVWSEKSDGGYFHIYVAPIVIGPRHEYERDRVFRSDEWQGCGDSAYDTINGLLLGSLRMQAQGGHYNDESKPRELYAFRCEYFQMYSVDRGQAKAMAKTFETIDRRLDKLRSKYGRETKFSQFVGYVADAIGAVEFRIQRTGEDRYRYAEKWRTTDIKDGLYAIDRLEYEWTHEKELRAEEQRREQAAAEYERERAQAEATAIAEAEVSQ